MLVTTAPLYHFPRKKTYMKSTRILNPRQISYLFDHLMDGFAATRLGIIELSRLGIITAEEFVLLILKNEERLLARIAEFKIANRITALLFACIITALQVTGDDLNARRPSRTRRRNESQTIEI